MSGSMIQLGAIGRQDVETFVKPEMTMFKSIYKRHTPFTLEPKTIEFTGNTDWNRRVSATMDRVGDLCCKVYLYMEVGRLNNGLGGCRFVEDFARAACEELQLDVGTVQYDKLYPELMHAWEELSVVAEKHLGKVTGKSQSIAELVTMAQSTQYLYIPLIFYFENDYGSAIPLVALHLTDVKIYVKLRAKDQLIVGVGAPYTVQASDAVINTMHLLCEIAILDDPERDWFANSNLKYLITQHQFLGVHTIRSGTLNQSIDLVFNHPVKELIWMFRTSTNTAALNYFNFSGAETGAFAGEHFRTAALSFNAQPRVQPLDPFYFRVLQNKAHHTRIPLKHVYTYSFALFPQDNQPSGSANLSRIDTVRMTFTFSSLPVSTDLFMYARNINSCTVASGVCLLSFAS